jgi:hypothetical protein
VPAAIAVRISPSTTDWLRRCLARHGKGGMFGKLSRVVEWALFDVGCAYGTSPVRVMVTSAIIIAAFALLAYTPVLLANDATPVAGKAFLQSYAVTGMESVDDVISAFIQSTSAFVSGFDGVDKNVEGWPAVALTLEGLLGMVMLGLFIVAFSRKVIR